MATRALVVCLLAGLLGQPAAAATGASGVEAIIHRAHVLDAVVLRDFNEAVGSWLHTQTHFPNGPIRPSRTPLAFGHRATGDGPPCGETLAMAADAKCVSACDATKDSCERQCGSVRATCLAQCPGLGFACDYYCQAAHLVCKGNCGRARDSCVSNCPTKGGQKEL